MAGWCLQEDVQGEKWLPGGFGSHWVRGWVTWGSQGGVDPGVQGHLEDSLVRGFIGPALLCPAGSVVDMAAELDPKGVTG